MALVQKVLTIIARILLGICAVVGVACLVYTLSTAAVQAGFNSAAGAVANLVSQAEASLEAGVTSAVAGAVPTSGGTSAQASAGEVTADAADGDSAAQAPADAGDAGAQAPDEGLAASYRQWADAVSSPLARVFGQTGVDDEVLSGAAGGSAQALSVLTGLTDAELSAASQNASNLAATASAHVVPADLPQDVREQLAQADFHVAAFCEDARKLVDAVRTLRGGNVLGAGGVTSAAYAAHCELEAMEDCVAQAEKLLGL